MLKSRALSCQRVGVSHRINLFALHCICEMVLPTKDAPIIFAYICFSSRNHELAFSIGYENDINNVFHPPYLPTLLFLLLKQALKRKFQKVILTEAIMAKMLTGLL